MALVGSNTSGVQTGDTYIRNSKTKKRDGDGGRCEELQKFYQPDDWNTSLPRPSRYSHHAITYKNIKIPHNKSIKATVNSPVAF